MLHILSSAGKRYLPQSPGEGKHDHMISKSTQTHEYSQTCITACKQELGGAWEWSYANQSVLCTKYGCMQGKEVKLELAKAWLMLDQLLLFFLCTPTVDMHLGSEMSRSKLGSWVFTLQWTLAMLSYIPKLSLVMSWSIWHYCQLGEWSPGA